MNERCLFFFIFAAMKNAEFTQKLMHWHSNENKREMPWKGEKDPYRIWLSEVILQQTRVEQGWSYYEKFITTYPTIKDLAKTADEEAFKLWEGLGYYNRCKNLLFTARHIAQEYNGQFPTDYETILSLKGIGPYTAAAIASFAFNLPYAVVDGNVFRVLSRYFGIDKAIDSTEGIKTFTALANSLIDRQHAGLYNQAIMDFGATVCKPALPLCNTCALEKNCVAHNKGIVNHLPVKEKLLKKKNRWFSWFILQHKGDVFITKRTARDIWQNLHEFYLVETDERPEWTSTSVSEVLLNQLGIKKVTLQQVSPVFTQQLTHQTIRSYFLRAEISSVPSTLKEYTRTNLPGLKQFAFPGIINQYLQTPSLQSTLF